jgi:hypothetical protein
MAEMTPKMGSQTKAKRIILVSGVVAWAWEMEDDKTLVCFINTDGASLGRKFLEQVTRPCPLGL